MFVLAVVNAVDPGDVSKNKPEVTAF